MGQGQELYEHAKTLIPGGTQLLSKRPEMFLPDHWVSYYSKALGAEVWDLDGRRYVDMSINSVGTCPLGYADPDVNRAVIRAIEGGVMSTLNCPEEVELAETLCSLHPWAEMVRFLRTGGEAMAAAVRIARAATGRDRIAFCGYHGWHDWYLAANLHEDDALSGHLLPGLSPHGVPRSLAGSALPFATNRADQLEDILLERRGEIAAVVMEPVRSSEPEPGFLERVRALASEHGAVLIFDEITVGFRLTLGGAHLLYGVDPDIAVFAKALGNGHPMAAVIGREAVMQAAQSTFISSTYWTERVGPVAALATIEKFKRVNASEHIARMGRRVQEGWLRDAEQAGLSVSVGGLPSLALLNFESENPEQSQTLFTQLMLDRGFLASKAFYPTWAHRDEHVDRYLEAVQEVFGILAKALEGRAVEEQLRGPPAHSGFHRLT